MEFEKDPKVSLIVPAYDVPPDVFKRCLTSIADQDYTDIEVIIVPNGGDKDAESFAVEFSKGKENWKVVSVAEKNACNARNVGFRESTGDIVSFVNSDYILKTGIVRVWVDKLLENPDCGFVYGAYEYSTANRDVYWSKPFDTFQLEVANYIDCGFPLWRKYVVEWDVNCNSLQDWDFWLRVVKNGVKGHYLGREISFVALPPRPKGLSHDSSQNWETRVRYVKDKNGIPERDICVASIGAPFHGTEIAKMIGADFRDDTLHKPHKYDALYLIGWYMKPGEGHNGHSQIVSAFPKSKKILHFVGADIFWLREFSRRKILEFAGALRMAFDHILCENEAAQQELRGYGIEADILPIPPYTDFFAPLDLPKEFTVALYLTDNSDFDKYLQAHTLSIVKAMPDVKFAGYGDSELIDPNGVPFKAKNFTMKGTLNREEWTQFVVDCSAYLRIVRHDTRPMASDEFVMAGRSVITNIPNPYMDVIDTSGTMPFDAWDRFAPGFSAVRWPSTKAEIVRKIREIKNAQAIGHRDFEGERFARSIAIKSELRKDDYRMRIRDLAKVTPVLEVVA